MQRKGEGGVVGRVEQGPADQRSRWIRKLPEDDEDRPTPEYPEANGQGTKGPGPPSIDIFDRNQHHDRREDGEGGVKPERRLPGTKVEGQDVPVRREPGKEVIRGLGRDVAEAVGAGQEWKKKDPGRDGWRQQSRVMDEN